MKDIYSVERIIEEHVVFHEDLKSVTSIDAFGGLYATPCALPAGLGGGQDEIELSLGDISNDGYLMVVDIDRKLKLLYLAKTKKYYDAIEHNESPGNNVAISIPEFKKGYIFKTIKKKSIVKIEVDPVELIAEKLGFTKSVNYDTYYRDSTMANIGADYYKWDGMGFVKLSG